MTNADKDSAKKEAIIAGLKAACEEAPSFRQYDNPLVYSYLEEFFLEFLNGKTLSKEDLVEFFAAMKVEEKVLFKRIFDENGNFIDSDKKTEDCEKIASDEEVDVTLESPESSTPIQSPSQTIEKSESAPEIPEIKPETPESKFEAKIQSRLAESEMPQPPKGVTVGKFANILSKFDYNIDKNSKKKNLDPLIKLIETEHCKYDNGFIGDLTRAILKRCCVKAKSGDIKFVERMVINALDLIKRYLNNNITLELNCISAIQSYVYSVKNEYPGKIYI
jgi:hypothetical protein